ncbi:MAG: DUF6807 family protein [Planctomycetota bacterium]|nr:DUF6807 family protein [Planctomycetota bacterium]
MSHLFFNDVIDALAQATRRGCLRTAIIFCACLSSVSLRPVTSSAHELTFRSDGDGTSIFEQGQLVITYQATVKSQKGKWKRANYLHPVIFPSGEVLTEDFPKDHPHHRGVFWAWHQAWVKDLRYGDGWACERFNWNVVSSKAHRNHFGITIANDVIWESLPSSQQSETDETPKSHTLPILHEKNWIHVHPMINTKRIIDISISLTAIQEGVRIGGSENVKGYGGFSVRMALDGSENFTSLGEALEPTIQAIQGGPWVNISNKGTGLAIINDLNNPSVHQGKSDWILRRKYSMQNAAFPGRQPISIDNQKPLRLRYRLVLHNGKALADELEAISKDLQNTLTPWHHQLPE